MTSTDIIKRLELVHKLKNRKKTILIEGNWGIGKTYSYREFIKNNKLNDIYISLFNILDINEIDKKIIIKYFLKNNNKIIENIKNKTENIFNKLQNKVNKKVRADNLINKLLNNFAGINLNNLFEIIDINTLDFDKNTVICFDDLERLNDNLKLKNVLGKIEQLHNKVTIVIICNTEKLSEKNKEIFNEYKEKVIDNIYQMSELDSDFIADFIKESNLKTENQEFLIDFFLKNGNNNLRYLQKVKDNYEELKLTCENADWFFYYEKDILEGIACLEAENCFQTYSNEHLETLRGIEEHFKAPNSIRQPKTEEELKKEVNFLDVIPFNIKKIIEIIILYNKKNIDIKIELQKYFYNQEIYKKFYDLCNLYFLKGENEIEKSFKDLRKIFIEDFNKLNFKDKFRSFIVLNKYLKDLKKRNQINNITNLNVEKEILKTFIRQNIKENIKINFRYDADLYLDNCDTEEISILENIQKEVDEEVQKEFEDEIFWLIQNQDFDKISELKYKNLKIHSYEKVQDFFEILLSKSCPVEYWHNYENVFSLLDDNLRKKILSQIKAKSETEKDTILGYRNFYLIRNLKRDFEM